MKKLHMPLGSPRAAFAKPGLLRQAGSTANPQSRELVWSPESLEFYSIQAGHKSHRMMKELVLAEDLPRGVVQG